MNQPENPTRHGLSGCLTTADLAATHAIEAAPTPSPDHRTTLRGHPTRTKKTAKPSPTPTTAKTTRRRHQVLAAQVSDIIDTHWKQGAGYHTLHKIATQPLSWCPPLSTTNPDKSPTLGHPANHDMHQRTGQRRKAQAHKSHPGYGTQHAAPWGHTFAPPPDMSRLHTFTHQGSPTRLRPTRNNPPQPQIPQRGRQARRSEDRRPMPWRITTSNHPDQQASDPTHHQPQKNHPHRDHTSTRGQRTGEPTASNKTPKPPRPHTNMKPPNHPPKWPGPPPPPPPP